MTPTTSTGEIETISPTVNVYPWVYQGKIVSYMIQRSTELVEQEVALTPAEYNALASHAPIIKAMKAALLDALDFIEDDIMYFPDWYCSDFNHKRSRVIEGAYAAIQGMEDAGE